MERRYCGWYKDWVGLRPGSHPSLKGVIVTANEEEERKDTKGGGPFQKADLSNNSLGPSRRSGPYGLTGRTHRSEDLFGRVSVQCGRFR